MNVVFLEPAEAELREAIVYYNEQRQGLGYEFAAEAKRTIERIVLNPHAWKPLSRRARRCRTNRFPYGLVYQVRDETILILAVMHLHGHPDAWKSRLKPHPGEE